METVFNSAEPIRYVRTRFSIRNPLVLTTLSADSDAALCAATELERGTLRRIWDVLEPELDLPALPAAWGCGGGPHADAVDAVPVAGSAKMNGLI